MRKGTTTPDEVTQFRQDFQSKLRMKVREAIEATLDEELAAALGSQWYERSEGRRGYRNGVQRRVITTELGPHELAVPRGRVVHDDGSSSEFRSEVVPRYARRTRQVDEAILGVYLAGANSRRIRKALEPPWKPLKRREQDSPDPTRRRFDGATEGHLASGWDLSGRLGRAVGCQFEDRYAWGAISQPLFELVPRAVRALA